MSLVLVKQREKIRREDIAYVLPRADLEVSFASAAESEDVLYDY